MPESQRIRGINGQVYTGKTSDDYSQWLMGKAQYDRGVETRKKFPPGGLNNGAAKKKTGGGSLAGFIVCVIAIAAVANQCHSGSSSNPGTQATNTTSTSPGNNVTQYAIVNTLRLNLRSCPEVSPQCTSVVEMQQGDKVILNGYKGDNWWDITYQSKDGPVHGFARAVDSQGNVLLAKPSTN